MYILYYLLGLLVLYLIFRKGSERLRNVCIVVYNYIVAVILYAIPNLPEGKLDALLRSVYLAPEALGFDANLDLYSSTQMTLLFLILALCTIRSAVILLFRKTVNTLTCKCRLFWAKHVYVIWGKKEDANALILDTQKQFKKAVILYIPNEDVDDKTYIPGVLTATKDVFSHVKNNKNYHIVLLPSDYHKNLEKMAFLNNLNAKNIHVSAYIDNQLLRLKDFHYDNTDAYIVSKEQLLVRNYLTENLPLKKLVDNGLGTYEKGIFIPDKAFQLCMIGFTPLAQEFLLTTYENTAFATEECPNGGSGLKAVIIDKNLDEKKPEFICNYPQMASEKGLEWHALSCNEQTFFDTLSAKLKGLDQILVDTGCTDQNIKTVQQITTMMNRMELTSADGISPQIITVLYETAHGVAQLFADYPNVVILQAGANHFTYNELFLRETDTAAEALHAKYNKTASRKDNWNTLGTFTQTSNRNVIWDIPNKLLLAGDLSNKSDEEKEQIYWQLAQYEHLRWNAFHFAHGWSTLPVSEMTEDEVANCKTKRPNAKKHTCLVDWDTLDSLPQSKPGILKWYDYENVVGLFKE